MKYQITSIKLIILAEFVQFQAHLYFSSVTPNHSSCPHCSHNDPRGHISKAFARLLSVHFFLTYLLVVSGCFSEEAHEEKIASSDGMKVDEGHEGFHSFTTVFFSPSYGQLSVVEE